MRTRLILTLGAAVLIAVTIYFGAAGYWQNHLPKFDVKKLIAASQAYTRDQLKTGQPPPSSISLSNLVAGGYLKAEEARAFDGIQVLISNSVSNSPQSVLIQLQMPDGTRIVALDDGSVQQLPK